MTEMHRGDYLKMCLPLAIKLVGDILGLIFGTEKVRTGKLIKHSPTKEEQDEIDLGQRSPDDTDSTGIRVEF